MCFQYNTKTLGITQANLELPLMDTPAPQHLNKKSSQPKHLSTGQNSM